MVVWSVVPVLEFVEEMSCVIEDRRLMRAECGSERLALSKTTALPPTHNKPVARRPQADHERVRRMTVGGIDFLSGCEVNERGAIDKEDRVNEYSSKILGIGHIETL
jgi:hypothetical protein